MTYQLKKIDYPTYIDQIGYKYGIYRLPNEDINTFKIRLLAITKDLPRADFDWFKKNCSGLLGLVNQHVFSIDIIRDEDGIPLAPDPVVKIVYDNMILYSDYANQVIELSIDISEYSAYKFINDVVNLINSSSNFTITQYNTDYAYYKSHFLLKGTNIRVVDNEPLVGTRSNKLKHNLIKDVYMVGNQLVNEKGSLNFVNTVGDYYIDYINGVIFTYEDLKGLVSYRYNVFPYSIFYSSIATTSLKDDNIQALFQEPTTDVMFEKTYDGLSRQGYQLLKQLNDASSLYWK